MRVARLRRYPVKSMLGEELRSADVSADGIAGDRAFGLIHDETGKVVSAKNPRLWRAMLTFTAIGYPDVAITGPGGDPVRDLSDALGHQVTLADTPPERPRQTERNEAEIRLVAGFEAEEFSSFGCG